MAEEHPIRRHTCQDIDECESSSLNHCPHECINLKGSYQCKCSSEYKDTHGDGTVCEATWRDESIVLIAYGSEIRQVRQNFTDYAYTTLIENENQVIALDVDPQDRVLYWIDGETQKIKRTFIPVSKKALGNAQALVQTDIRRNSDSLPRLTAITVDWLAKNVYYAQSNAIIVAKTDGRYPKKLITEHVSDVRSIQVNPIIGLVSNSNKRLVFNFKKLTNFFKLLLEKYFGLMVEQIEL